MVVVIGYQLYETARSDYGMSIREASFQLGLLRLVQFLPLAVLTPIAGWAADRFEGRSVAIFSKLIDMGLAEMLGCFTWREGLTMTVLYGLRYGRASGREGVCRYVSISVGADS